MHLGYTRNGNATRLRRQLRIRRAGLAGEIHRGLRGPGLRLSTCWPRRRRQSPTGLSMPVLQSPRLPARTREGRMSDRLDMAYINSLPQPLIGREIGGWKWPIYDICVETG